MASKSPPGIFMTTLMGGVPRPNPSQICSFTAFAGTKRKAMIRIRGPTPRMIHRPRATLIGTVYSGSDDSRPTRGLNGNLLTAVASE